MSRTRPDGPDVRVIVQNRCRHFGRSKRSDRQSMVADRSLGRVGSGPTTMPVRMTQQAIYGGERLRLFSDGSSDCLELLGRPSVGFEGELRRGESRERGGLAGAIQRGREWLALSCCILAWHLDMQCFGRTGGSSQEID